MDLATQILEPALAERPTRRPSITRSPLRDPRVWRDAALVWLAQRIAFALLTLLGRWLFAAQRDPSAWHSWSALRHVWTNWDGAIYGAIATDGYQRLPQAAFFPLFPLLERLLAPLTGGRPLLAGLLIANASSLAAFVLLRALAEREMGRATARRALLYLAIFPTSFFLAAAYTESLFLLLSLAAFLALRRERCSLAGLFAALATLTRPVGILLLAPLVIAGVSSLRLAWKTQTSEGSRHSWRVLTPMLARILGGIALPIVALFGFEAYLAARLRVFPASSVAQTRGWGRSLTWPWTGFLRAWAAIADPASPMRLHAALDIAFTLLFIALTLTALRRLPLPYAVYAVATLALVLLTPMQRADFAWAALSSTDRFLLVVFPLFLVMGQWGARRPWAHRLIFVPSFALLLLFTLAWVGGAFVA